MVGRSLLAALAKCVLLAPLASTAATEHQLLVLNTAYFSPDRSGATTIVITQGDTVTLTNADPFYLYGTQVIFPQYHSVVDESGLDRFGTGLVGPGGRANVRDVSTLQPGLYRFTCARHANMRGSLLVNPAS